MPAHSSREHHDGAGTVCLTTGLNDVTTTSTAVADQAMRAFDRILRGLYADGRVPRLRSSSRGSLEGTDVRVWRKSSYSSTGGANCVEAGDGTGGVLVRDTKPTGMGPRRTVLEASPSTWRSFTAAMRRDSASR